MEMLFNTELAVRSVGVRLPEGEKARGDTACMFCGKPIPIGSSCQPVKLGRGSFMDDAWFPIRSQVSCLHCVAMTSSKVAKKLGSANCIVYTLDGALPIAKDAARAWFLLTPPEPPFVVTASATINFQHLIWKSPVTYSRELIHVGWPTRTMTIRHSVLMRAVEVCRAVAAAAMEAKEAALKESKKKGAKVKPMTHPYICLDRELSDLNHGIIRPDIAALAKTIPAIADGLAFLKGLSLGETWALATLVKSKQEVPTKPDPLDTVPADVLLT